jgi:hypothetical protein
VPKFAVKQDPQNPRQFDILGPSCSDPGSQKPLGKKAFPAASKLKAKAENLKEKAEKAHEDYKKAGAGGNFNEDCNARMVDMPYGLMNPEAAKNEEKSAGKELKEALGLRRTARVPPSQSVWGLAVHGKSGTYAFDSGGKHAADYIYAVPQGNGLPADYYVCDSRVNPTACALIGGNMRHACAEWYDPQQCHFCEDHGTSLTCEIRGWNPTYKEWTRVPIYPRDLLGEQYRGEFRDVMGAPMWASIKIAKKSLKSVKEMPDYMVTDLEPMVAIKQWQKGPKQPPNQIMSIIGEFSSALADSVSESQCPDPGLVATFSACHLTTDPKGCERKLAERKKAHEKRVDAKHFL